MPDTKVQSPPMTKAVRLILVGVGRKIDKEGLSKDVRLEGTGLGY